jgi:hypothetical protein
MRRRMLVLSALVISMSVAASGVAAAANPNRTFDVSACATLNGQNLILTAVWSGMRADAWSYFIESTEGSGGVFQPVPEPGRSGTLTNTFPAEDVANIQSVEATIFRAAGPNSIEVASTTLTQPAAGWTTC